MTDRAQKVDPNADPVHVAIRDLQKAYEDAPVLRGVTFDIFRGEINVIIGGSGAGKSVFTRQLLRLERPDKGQILVDGEDIAQLDDWKLVPFRKKFGMVFQFGALFDSMSVFDNVAFPLREHTKMSRKEIRDRVMERLATLNVAHAEKKLGCKLGESTADGRVYLKREEECVAACCGAPVVVINGHYHEKLTPAKVDELLDGLE